MKRFKNKSLPLVCIQGVGFVGAAMAIAVANASDNDGHPYFNVMGVDLPTAEGKSRVRALNSGRFPFEISDPKMAEALDKAMKQGNLLSTTDENVYERAAIVVVDVPLDIDHTDEKPTVNFTAFESAIETLGERLQSGALVIVETTVPPGTCDKIVAPLLNKRLEKRGLNHNDILLAHAYERVMPGAEYFDSIVNFWRVYAGHTEKSADACESFFSKIINTAQFPLTRLQSTTASETGKVLENSYRAVNIAFIEEWGRFAEEIGVDLFEVIEAIRVRPTHNNIRQPGFGVGGYCLTKDPLFGMISSTEIYELNHLQFPFSKKAVEVNQKMPLVTLSKLKRLLGGALFGKKVLLLGVSYRPDVGDTRYSPSSTFYHQAVNEGAVIACQDPLVNFWPEINVEVNQDLPQANEFDGIVFAVPHAQYQKIDMGKWLSRSHACIVDANNVLSREQRNHLLQIGIPFDSVGRGIRG